MPLEWIWRLTGLAVGIIGAHFDGAAKPLAFGGESRSCDITMRADSFSAMATAQPLGFIIGLCLGTSLPKIRTS